MNEVLYNDLRQLCDMVNEREQICQDIELGKRELITVSTKTPNLDKFDKENKDSFISVYQGEEPEDISTGWKVAGFLVIPPLSSIGMGIREKWFRKQKKKYNERVKNAEDEYYEAYKEEIEEKKRLDREYQNDEMTRVAEKIKLLSQRHEALQTEIENNKIVADTFKSSDKLKKLVSYVEEGRVDNVKEMINLFYEEQKGKMAINNENDDNFI